MSTSSLSPFVSDTKQFLMIDTIIAKNIPYRATLKALTAENRNDTKPVFDIIDTLEREIDEYIKK